MNSYNENLHTSVLETLSEQELKLQKSKELLISENLLLKEVAKKI